MLTAREARGVNTDSVTRSLPLLKIEPCDDVEDSRTEVNESSDINLSVCIHDVPLSPTQHAEFTLALTPRSWRRRYRSRKRPVVDIHACFDVNDISGTVTVVDEGEVALSKNCTRYERNSVDLLGFGCELDGLSHDSDSEEFTLLSNPSRCHSHQTRLTLINLCRRR